MPLPKLGRIPVTAVTAPNQTGIDRTNPGRGCDGNIRLANEMIRARSLAAPAPWSRFSIHSTPYPDFVQHTESASLFRVALHHWLKNQLASSDILAITPHRPESLSDTSLVGRSKVCAVYTSSQCEKGTRCFRSVENKAFPY